MSSDNLKGIIELGNEHFKCLIFEVTDYDQPKIISSSIMPSKGISNGTITNLLEATRCIRSCVGEAEKIANITIKKISIVFEQPEFLCTKLSKNRKVNGAEIQRDDINFLLKEGKKQVTQNDENYKIIHIFNHNYIVDGKKFYDEHIGVYSDHLRHEMTFLTAPKSNIKNINQTFINSDIEVERYFSSTFALAAQLLNINELKHGSILIDVGFEKISVGFFQNIALLNSFTIPIGVNHIAKDISKVCLLDLPESHAIKNKLDFSFKNNDQLFSSDNLLKDIYFKKTDYRKISKSLIYSIVKARLDEVFLMIKKNLFIEKNISLSAENFFITGDGSCLSNLESCFSNYFGVNVKKIKINSSKKNNKNLENSFDFITCLGAIKIITEGWETEAIPVSTSEERRKIGFFQRIFGNN